MTYRRRRLRLTCPCVCQGEETVRIEPENASLLLSNGVQEHHRNPNACWRFHWLTDNGMSLAGRRRTQTHWLVNQKKTKKTFSTGDNQVLQEQNRAAGGLASNKWLEKHIDKRKEKAQLEVKGFVSEAKCVLFCGLQCNKKCLYFFVCMFAQSCSVCTHKTWKTMSTDSLQEQGFLIYEQAKICGSHYFETLFCCITWITESDLKN